MTQHVVNNSSPTTPLAMFHAAVVLHDVADQARDEAAKNLHADIIEAIGKNSADMPAEDMPNVAHRICAALGQLDRIYDRATRGLDVENEINLVEQLLRRAVCGIENVAGVDIDAWRLEYYAGHKELRTALKGLERH
ncbi:hypothetical protein OIU34_27760 [Pararhizobium sp. BT-229]|uniref:hypothetical protein n=1 Tax=Pararhizobium sp. BT-229 TaxID=2986923 RepID=UPI0021F6CA4F|nr:hypothetical protein [Pararhizobium sp. BT-229]MCV9965674.1 hypothetical protein [Pararhizobium sp. BT-229]